MRRKNLFYFLLLLVCGQLLWGCGTDTTLTGEPQNTAVATTKISPTTAPSPTPTIDPVELVKNSYRFPVPTVRINQVRQAWLELLDRNEQVWKAKNVTAYEIEVSYHNTPWPPGEVYNISVRNGQVVQTTYSLTACFSCSDKTLPTPESAKRSYQDYKALTILGLFDFSRTMVKADWTEETAFQVRFNPYYGFPAEIIRDNKRYTDVGKYWKVESFKELS